MFEKTQSSGITQHQKDYAAEGTRQETSDHTKANHEKESVQSVFPFRSFLFLSSSSLPRYGMGVQSSRAQCYNLILTFNPNHPSSSFNHSPVIHFGNCTHAPYSKVGFLLSLMFCNQQWQLLLPSHVPSCAFTT